MRKVTTLLALGCVAALCAAILAGCGNSGSSSSATSSSSTAASTEATGEEASSNGAASGSAPSDTASSGSTAPDTAAVMEPEYDPTDLLAAFDSGVGYEADTAGGSLKTAMAAAALVQVVAERGTPQDLETVASNWRDGLDETKRQVLTANWTSISEMARQIAKDPASQSGTLSTAGVTTDFSTMDLSKVSAALDTLDGVFGEEKAK